MSNSHRFIWLMSGILVSVSAVSSAGTIVVEDFEDGTVGAFDPFINYQFIDTAEISARLLGDWFSPPGYLLFISRNTAATLTFNTLPSQTVASASLEFADRSGGGSPTIVEFVGEQSSKQFSLKNAGPATISTDGLDLGPIVEIRLLGSLESSFDNIVLEVVPEPSTILLCAGLMLATLAGRRQR